MGEWWGWGLAGIGAEVKGALLNKSGRRKARRGVLREQRERGRDGVKVSVGGDIGGRGGRGVRATAAVRLTSSNLPLT